MSTICQRIDKPLIQCETYGCKERSVYRIGSSKFPHTCTDLCETCAGELLNSMKDVLGDDINALDDTMEGFKHFLEGVTNEKYDTRNDLVEKATAIIKQSVREALYKEIIDIMNNKSLNIPTEQLDILAEKHGIKFTEDMVNKYMKFQHLVKYASGELDIDIDTEKEEIEEEKEDDEDLEDNS